MVTPIYQKIGHKYLGNLALFFINLFYGVGGLFSNLIVARY
jgi:hypothetical protein